MATAPMPDPNAYYGSKLGVGMYDLFTGQGLLEGDVDFYLRRARIHGSPILELGAGSGRLLLPLADAGFEVVGVDLSRPMLERAAAKLAERPDLRGRVTLIESSMADFHVEKDFALAIIAARSFQHVTDPLEQRATLERVRRHMLPGGVLILDLFDPNFELLFAAPRHAPPPRKAIDPQTGNTVHRTVVARQCDPFAQTITETLLFVETDAAGATVAEEETSWTLRWSQRQETAWLLELCGFAPVELFSDFEGSPPACGREQLWIARAK